MVLPPIAVAAGAAVLKSARLRRARGGRVRLQYGQFTLECDASHHLPNILSVLPDFGRPLADVVTAIYVPEPSVIDIGANIGDTALLLARFAPGARVLCIEGDSKFMPDLKLNTSQITGVTIAERILGDRTGEIRGRFTSRPGHEGTAHVAIDAQGERLRIQALDDLLAEHPAFARPDVIKIDTDGFEPAILRGSERVLRSMRPVLFYEWDPYSYGVAGEDDCSHAEFLMSVGYTRFFVFTNTGQPMVRLHKPERQVWESLARFSRGRRGIDGWHYDIAAFPDEREDVLNRLSEHYSMPAPRTVDTARRTAPLTAALTIFEELTEFVVSAVVDAPMLV